MAPPAERIGPSELRARRAASIALGAALLAYTVADLLAIREDPAMLSHGWWIVSTTGRLAFGIVFLTLPWFSGPRALRILAFSFLAFGGAMALVFIAAVDAEFAWAVRPQSLYVWAAPLALRPLPAWAWILVFEALTATSRAMRTGDPFQFLESTLVALTLTVLLVFLLMMLLRVTRARDLREQSTLCAIREDAYQAARAAELRRIERIVHDDVLSALRAASLGLVTDRANPALLARAALDRLAVLDRFPDDAPVAADDLLNRLRSLVTATAPEAEVQVVSTGAPEIPADVAAAIVEACGEALRNSVGHAPADRRVSRTVRARIEPEGVEVVVADDGDGFDVRRVPSHRLGIARSIVERMRALPGGDATLRSSARSGTSVSMSWRA